MNWHDITESLPTDPGYYVLRWNDNDMEVFMIDKNELLDIADQNGIRIGEIHLHVTHWLKLPEVTDV